MRTIIREKTPVLRRRQRCAKRKFFQNVIPLPFDELVKNPILDVIAADVHPPRINHVSMSGRSGCVDFIQDVSHGPQCHDAAEPMHSPFGMFVIDVAVLNLEQNVAGKVPRFPRVQCEPSRRHRFRDSLLKSTNSILLRAASPSDTFRPRNELGAALDKFSFFFAFYGLILGLAVAELLGGFAGMVRAHALKKLEAQTALLALLTFVLICATWVDAFTMSRSITLDFSNLWAPILLATFYYLAAAVIFPRDPGQYAHLRAYFAA